LVFAIKSDVATQKRSRMPPADEELKNSLKTLRLMSFAIVTKITFICNFNDCGKC
jgi:hypothetical protein